MQLLSLDESYLKGKGAHLTAAEIAGQPDLWHAVEHLFFEHSESVHAFLSHAYKEADNIIFTGAGTSAFIGLSLEGAFFRNTKIQSRAIATTNIVSSPQDYFNASQTSLIISFARSGNSPESNAALKLADTFSKKCFHLIITCDENGSLAQYETTNPKYVFVLPETANDKSLAMTGSYSGMLLTGLMMAYINHPSIIKNQVQLLIKAAGHILSDALTTLQKTAVKDFRRAMFLGSGNLLGTATEAALKLQELTDGKIICKEDSYLGLRHGPKAVIDKQTLVVYFFSNNDYVKQYEHDLVGAMKSGNNALYELAVTEKNESGIEVGAQINFGNRQERIEEDFLPVCAIVPAQILAFYKSLDVGLSPDNPSVNGAISRVVQGVTIYSFETGITI
ncbi:SIS domain-containing protein [Parafilimonas terrae]|uniref:Galactosamine 6-phosphate isomerase AgaS n=1 Tax=Parafilimonas terrae TaxID=1465490 RepID=A0A1I5Y8F3_9BACT|nr:SIS domain-containing protein [Parafilimonas terrae]SFQ40522.1 galactosamine 6-phosphate isomerase AgaS [Parafilimonas terrae]